MAERIQSSQQITEEERMKHPFSKEAVADILDVSEEMEHVEGDNHYVFVSVAPEYYHLLVAAVLFDERDRFKQNGIHITQKAARFLEESMGVPYKLVGEPPSIHGVNHELPYTIFESNRDVIDEFEKKEKQPSRLSQKKSLPKSGTIAREQLRRSSNDLW